MSKWYPIKVQSVRSLTPESVIIAFDIPDDWKEDFRFKAGQYVTVEAEINGEKVRRAYSLCVAPEEDKWEVAVKKVPGGKFSVWANEVLRAGFLVRLLPPEGKFTLPSPEIGENDMYVAFVAGSGITPVMSLLKHVLMTNDTAKFSLFYGNKTAEDVMFREQLEQLKNRYLGRLSVYHVFSREQALSPLFSGRITAEKVFLFAGKLFNPKDVTAFFACGPGQMVVDVVEALKGLEVPKDNIKYELFTPVDNKKKGDVPPIREEQKSTLDKVKLSIELDGDVFTMEVDPQWTILDAGLMNDLDLPYACKAGICCTCKAKVVEGEVRMERADSLEPYEIEEGLILTCQAYPKTEVVKVDFDI